MSRWIPHTGPLLALLAVGLDPSPVEGPRASLLLLVAALVAWPGRTSAVLGLAALTSVMTPGLVANATPMGWAACAALAVAVGLSARSLERRWTRPMPLGDLGGQLWLCVAGLLLTLAPDGTLLLLDTTGGLATAQAVVEDAATGTRRAVTLPLAIDQVHPGDVLLGLTSFLAPATIFLLLAGRAMNRERWRISEGAAGVVGALLCTSALLGLAQLLGGETISLEPEALSARLDRLGGGEASVTVEGDLSGHLGLGSRPLVDALRLCAGGALILGWYRRRRGDAATATSPRLDDTVTLGLALAVAVISAWMFGSASLSWGVSAGLLMGAVAMGLQGMGSEEDSTPAHLHMLSLAVWVFAILASSAGWTAAA